MNNLNHYYIRSIVWDICKRPIYAGKFTKKYINKCLELGLPLICTSFYVKSHNDFAAAYYLENLFGKKMRRYTISEMKNITDEDEVEYGFLIDTSLIEQN